MNLFAESQNFRGWPMLSSSLNLNTHRDCIHFRAAPLTWSDQVTFGILGWLSFRQYQWLVLLAFRWRRLSQSCATAAPHVRVHQNKIASMGWHTIATWLQDIKILGIQQRVRIYKSESDSGIE